MKRNIVTGSLFLLLSLGFVSLGIVFWIVGINSGNVNFVIGPLISLLLFFPLGIIFLIFAIVKYSRIKNN